LSMSPSKRGCPARIPVGIASKVENLLLAPLPLTHRNPHSWQAVFSPYTRDGNRYLWF
jgi:hypothetical protein